VAKEMDVNIIKGSPIASIDREKKYVVDNKNKMHPYDHLIIAPTYQQYNTHDHEKDKILHWKNKQAMVSVIQNVRPQDVLVLLGNNPVVCEAAFALAEKGVKVYILTERKKWLENILDTTAAGLLEEIMLDADIEILQNEKISIVERQGSMQKLIFESGKHLICNAVISFEDEYPDLAIAKAAGLNIHGALEVNAFLQTSDPSIFALGEAAVFNAEDSYLPEAGIRQAQFLAQYFRGNYSQYYTRALPRYKWSIPAGSGTGEPDLKISVMGNAFPLTDEGYEEIVFLDGQKYIYKKCIIQNDRLTGAIFIGDHEEDSQYHALIEEGTELGELRSQLLRPGNAQMTAAGKIICSCNQVGEANIIAAIENGCKTIEALGLHTGAGTTCGSCKPELNEMLKRKAIL
jgi:ferredoxin-nitrate reductase